MQDIIILTTWIIGIFCIITIIIFNNIMPKRTINGNEILGKIDVQKEEIKNLQMP